MYQWGIDGKGSVGISDVVELPQFKVKGIKKLQKLEVLTTGNYSRLVCELEFVRSMGYYLIQIYIPASLIVIISWVSFWLHRVSLNNSLFLCYPSRLRHAPFLMYFFFLCYFPERFTGSRTIGRNHCVDNDNTDVIHKCSTA